MANASERTAVRRNVISLLLENKSGTLSRVSGLFSARGYNIDSLSVGGTEDESLARMTIVASGTEETVSQIVKQLNKLVDVVQVKNLSAREYTEREMLLIKVYVDEDAEAKKLRQVIDDNGARLVERDDGYYVLELVSQAATIDEFIKLLRDYRCEEVVRSGVVAIGSGSLVLNVNSV